MAKVRDLGALEAIRLHDAVFGHHVKYSDPGTWEKYDVVIGNDRAFAAGCREGKFGYPHLSLAGVLESERGKGLYRELVQEFTERVGREQFTVTTFPDKFPVMARWVRSKTRKVLVDDGQILTAVVELS